MKHAWSIVLLPIVAALLAGCLSSDPVKFESKVRVWVPLGTTAADASRIMTQHGFDCYRFTTNNPFNSIGLDYLDCEMENVMFHDWYARFILRDGKVSEYGPIRTD